MARPLHGGSSSSAVGPGCGGWSRCGWTGGWRRRPLPFYAWLRQFAWERLIKLHRGHIQAQKRSLTHEETPVSFGRGVSRVSVFHDRPCGYLGGSSELRSKAGTRGG